MSTSPPPSYHTSEDEKLLHKLGYAQELFRAMGGFQNFAISFTIISILAGCLTSYWIVFERGGPMWVVWSWLIIGGFSTIIALADAEIASKFPTAGGLYYWASKLGSPGWGWATGWFNLIGQIAVTAAIGYGLATFAEVLFTYWFDYGPHMADWGVSYNASVYILYAIFLVAAGLINVFDIRITSGINTFSAYWHMLGVAIIVGVLIIVPEKHQSLSYVFTERVNNTGFGGDDTAFTSPAFWLVLGLGLLMAQYTITGFDASAHTAEETQNSSRMAAVGMYMSVVASVVFGWILLLAVTFAIPSTEGAIEQINNLVVVVPWIWSESMSQNWSEALLFICVVAQFFCVPLRPLRRPDDVRLLSRRRRSVIHSAGLATPCACVLASVWLFARSDDPGGGTTCHASGRRSRSSASTSRSSSPSICDYGWVTAGTSREHGASESTSSGSTGSRSSGWA
jgi:amino acid transporter